MGNMFPLVNTKANKREKYPDVQKYFVNIIITSAIVVTLSDVYIEELLSQYPTV